MGRVVHLDELLGIRENLRRQKKRVVFTNGVFDILHRGHVEYLTKARDAGDVLIVGLNSDASVRRIKGKNRPIVAQDDRAYVLSHVVPVDYVCVFDEDTPYQLISSLIPDVLVKGADWALGEIVGKDVVEKAGGKVATIEFVPDRSTTSIIDRIIDRFSSR